MQGASSRSLPIELPRDPSATDVLDWQWPPLAGGSFDVGVALVGWYVPSTGQDAGSRQRRVAFVHRVGRSRGGS
jgi:hypothetical protein